MIINKITSLPRDVKMGILLSSDAVFIIASVLLSFSLRLGYLYYPPGLFENKITWLIVLSPLIAIPIFGYFGLYRAVIRYIGTKASWSVVKAVSSYSIIWGLFSMLSVPTSFPRSVVLINFMVALIGIGGSRVLARYILNKADTRNLKNNNQEVKGIKVLIYGSGPSGRQLAVGLSHSSDYEMCGFIDDSGSMQGRDLLGYPVISRREISAIVELRGITDILLAIPSITRQHRNEILRLLQPLMVRVKTLPSMSYLTIGEANIDEIMDLDIEDLLMRDTIVSDDKPLISITKDKVVMVTGAGGSIGAEICRQVIKRSPKILMLLEISEYALYEIHQELEAVCLTLKGNEKLVALPRIIPFLGSIQDEARVTELMQTWIPDIVYHTAAYKHVPMVEGNLSEGIKNNVIGTLTMVKVAIEQGLKNFVLISTDKAVNPTNGMGASKRVAELILQAVSAKKNIVFESINGTPISVANNTHFNMVRFGNVLGSSGSVVPLFRKQIKSGGPITLTHKKITRYFMTISEASELVMHSVAIKDKKTNSGQVYVLDMGDPVKIIDLAKKMVELSGLRVKSENSINDSGGGGDIEIKITGLRPGEKLYEELLIGNNPQKTSNPKILKASESFIIWEELQEKVKNLKIAAENNDPEVIMHLLKDLVIGYKPESSISDFVYKEQNI